MWNRISLRNRIYVLLVALFAMTLAGGAVSVWYSYSLEQVLAGMIANNLAAYQSAQELETALINQKGFVSYYFMDGDPAWLQRLGEYRQIFKERLERARALAENESQLNSLKEIERKYTDYITGKDRVIALYKSGARSAGLALHNEIRDQFFDVFALCEAYKELHLARIKSGQLSSRSQAGRLRTMAVAGLMAVTVLASLLCFMLVRHVLAPIRQLSSEADRAGTSKNSTNEIKALSHSIHGLIEDIDKTHSELEKSREHLQQAEKLALVGKLAAGMAHSIRNPFTSVKMRLFSLARSLHLSDTQQDDLEVISEEIRHIDNIVQNFLEFSRPPKLKMQSVSPSSVVDSAIQLLEHRLRSYDVTIRVVREFLLPEIEADPEQLKEVVVNLIVNACEAMEKGGSIIIREQEATSQTLGRSAMIHVGDNGPGIPEINRDKVLQPFFTTKEEGTGLGLSIAARIVEEHGGRLDFTSVLNQGTTFTIALPLKG